MPKVGLFAWNTFTFIVSYSFDSIVNDLLFHYPHMYIIINNFIIDLELVYTHIPLGISFT